MNMQAPFIWGQGGQKLTPAQAKAMRDVAAALAVRRNTPQNLGEGLASVGDALLYNSNMARANEAESEGMSRVAQALAEARASGDPTSFLDVMGNEWASPGQQLIAGELYKSSKPDWQTAESGGDILRWNQNDPNSTPSVFYDGPDAAPEPPRIEEQFDPATGLPTKKQWNAATGTWDDFGGVAAPKEPVVTITNGGAEDELYKAGAKARGEDLAAIETAGYQAQGKIGQIARLEQLLSSAPQGFEGAWKQVAGEFGIATEGLDDIQAAQSLINKLVPEQRMPGTGPMSDADLALFKQSMPRIMNQPGGNALIMQTLKGIAVYEQQMGKIATAVLNKEITPAKGRELMAAVQNPLELFREVSGDAPEGVDPEDWAVMTPEQKALWN